MTTSIDRVKPWSSIAIDRLRNAYCCPLCDSPTTSAHCARCGADLGGEVAAQLWTSSQAAAVALEERQRLLDRLPVSEAPEQVISPPVQPVLRGATSEPRSSATVQSVLAVAGAGLVGIAAVVFTFFNPDMTDRFARAAIVALVTALFIIGTRTLAARRLRFSAEALGALATVFLILDVVTVSAFAPAAPWVSAGITTAVVGAAMMFLAVRTGVRVWMWLSLVAMASVPVTMGFDSAVPSAGWLGSAVVAFALLVATPRLAAAFGGPLRAERCTLVLAEILALLIGLGATLMAVGADELPWGWLSTVLVGACLLALATAGHLGKRMWSALAGVFGTAATASLPLAVMAHSGADPWSTALTGVGAVIGALLLIGVLSLPAAVARLPLAAGSLLVVVAAVAPSAQSAVLEIIATVLGLAGLSAAGVMAASVVALAGVAAGLIVLGLLRRATPLSWVSSVGWWVGGFAALSLLCVPEIVPGLRVALGLSVGVLFAMTARASSPSRLSIRALRLPLAASAHVVVATAARLSWMNTDLAVVAGSGVVAAILVLSITVPARYRFAHAAAAYGYGLVVLVTALTMAGLPAVPVTCVITGVGAVVAMTATSIPRIDSRTWSAILSVTALPFLLGVAQVVAERNGWTGLSTALIFLLALSLVLTRRRDVSLVLRLAAAVVLVPSLSVVVLCVGPQLLAGSGSPVVLPAIAMIVAAVLAAGGTIETGAAGVVGPRAAARVRLAIEASSLLTAVIAVALSLVREAAGPTTALIVFVILAIGGSGASAWAGRRYGWPLCGAALTGALWCGWSLLGVDLPEAYVLPPALGAAAVGLVSSLRRGRGRPLFLGGLLAAVLPLLWLGATTGPVPRLIGLIAASAILLVAAAVLGASETGRSLRTPALVVAIIAAGAGAAWGTRVGLGIDRLAEGVPPILVSLGVSAIGASTAAVAARTIRRHADAGSWARTTRWAYAPALAYLVAGSWAAVRRDWLTVWTLWGLLLALLVLLVVAARTELASRPGLPPVWFVLSLAFVTAVVAWSPRDLRVEWFSLPLGGAVLVAGALGLRERHPEASSALGRRLMAWPAGWTGSWAVLGPGIALLLTASVIAIFTDPLTWRAILVIVLALFAILVGAARRLSAPFILGILVLPLENAIAFFVQIGRGNQSMPWWITLAVVGAVLLIIAVTYERRSGDPSGLVARLRDLA